MFTCDSIFCSENIHSTSIKVKCGNKNIQDNDNITCKNIAKTFSTLENINQINDNKKISVSKTIT